MLQTYRASVTCGVSCDDSTLNRDGRCQLNQRKPPGAAVIAQERRDSIRRGPINHYIHVIKNSRDHLVIAALAGLWRRAGAVFVLHHFCPRVLGGYEITE